MDESRKPGDVSPAKNQVPKDGALPQALGATGIFGAAPESIAKSDRDLDADATLDAILRALQSRPDSSVDGLQEPIVHKVVIGRGSANSSLDFLELPGSSSHREETSIRSKSAATPLEAGKGFSGDSPSLTPTPIPNPVPGKSRDGLTQLFRALNEDSSPAALPTKPATAQPVIASPNAHPTGNESGFTSLLRKFGPEEGGDKPQANSSPGTPFRDVPHPDGVGGFTEVLRGFSDSFANPGETHLGQELMGKTHDQFGSSAAPMSRPTGSPPAGGPGAPGTFTQLLNSMAPDATDPVRSRPASSSPGSMETPKELLRSDMASRSSSEPASFTDLISRRSEPYVGVQGKGELSQPAFEDASRSRLSGDTDSHVLPVGPLASSVPPALGQSAEARSGGSAMSLTGYIEILRKPGSLDEPLSRPLPSELVEQEKPNSFTGVYELLEKPATPTQPAMQPPAAPAQSPYAPPSPSFLPPYPQPVAIPQPAPIPQVPVPQPSMPSLPPVAVAQPVMGKMQQYVPLLLMIIIFLLVVILVTVVFLLKH